MDNNDDELFISVWDMSTATTITLPNERIYKS